jgi:peptidoglycan/xylan/chitin deacetylase (PgdA/CDA1 family)
MQGTVHNASSARRQRDAAPVLGARLRTGAVRLFRGRPVILAYHGVGQSSLEDDPYLLRVRPDRFRAQIEAVLWAGYSFVTMAEFARQMTGDRERPTGHAVVTFDDGMQDNYENAMPLLSEYGIRATVYVIAGTIGRANPWMRPGLGHRMMTESELRELVSAGWDLGAHSMTHPDMSTLPYDWCLREMIDSKRTLEELAGLPVETFAYPFGSFGPAAVAAAQAAGFTAAVSTGKGNNRRYSLQRAMIGAADAFPIAYVKAAAVSEPMLSSRPATCLRRRLAALRRLTTDVRRRRLRHDQRELPPTP